MPSTTNVNQPRTGLISEEIYPITANSRGGRSGQERHFRTAHLLPDLGRRALSGAMLTIFSQGVRFGLSLGSTVILARVLVPRDFGLIAMAATLTGLLSMLREAGLSAATIQKAELTHAQVSNLFWVNLWLGAGCAVIGVAACPVIAWFFREPKLAAVTAWLCLCFIPGGAAVQHLALLKRQMRFRCLAVIDVGSMLISFVAGVVLAYRGYGFWSLVGAQVAGSFAEFGMAWSFCGWRPQMPIRESGTRALLNFGASLTLATLLRRVAGSADCLLLGRFYGSQPVGLYSRALALLTRPLDQFLVPLDMVFVPMLSRLQQQPPRYRETFLLCFNGIALISFPLAGLFLGLSRPLVLILLGPSWTGVVPIFAALAPAALYFPVAGAAMWLLTTQGRNRDILLSGAMTSICVIVACCVGLVLGPIGVALGLSLIGLIIRLPLQFYIAGRSGPVMGSDLWSAVLKHLPFWGIGALSAYMPQILWPRGTPFLQVLLGTAVALVASVVMIAGNSWYRHQIFKIAKLAQQSVRLDPRA